MTRRGSGYVASANGGKPVTRVPTTKDLLPPLPAVVPVEAVPVARAESGQIADSEAAKELGRRGGLAKATKKKLMADLGMVKLGEDAEFTPYYNHAQAWLKATSESIASQSGGYVGPSPMSFLQFAAAALAVAKYAQDRIFRDANLGLAALFKNMVELQRQNVLAATDLARREAESRAKAADGQQNFFDPFAQITESADD